MNPSQPTPQGQGMPAPDPTGIPMPPQSGAAAPQGVPAAPDPTLLPAASTAEAPGDAASAAWLPPTVPMQAAGQNAAQAQLSAPSVPAVADDADLIEKEWVTKAKEIVDRYRMDPYQQTKELHKFKAEYMKKRYNKVIESVEE